ncbi:MAG TPA: hypothetical protein DEA45_01355, partial [Acholeplasmataceae bacterium]|nr:hypothetical protein [Acholeplasmataceae bacterium]
EGLSDNVVILDRYVFLGYQNELSSHSEYEVSYISQHVSSLGGGVALQVVSDNYFDSGVIYKPAVHSHYFNIQETEILYESKNVNPTNPIIIDETTAIRLFDQINAVGKTVEVYIGDQLVSFTVHQVIRETKERLAALEYLKQRGSDQSVNTIDFSYAYIYVADYQRYTTTDFEESMMKLTYNRFVTQSDLDQITSIIGSDKELSVHSQLGYLERAKEEFQASIINNLIIALMVVFIYLIYFYFYIKKRFKEVKNQSYIEIIESYLRQNKNRVVFAFSLSNLLLVGYFYLTYGFFFFINAFLYIFVLVLISLVYVMIVSLSSYLAYLRIK